jgi:hypothetical protein
MNLEFLVCRVQDRSAKVIFTWAEIWMGALFVICNVRMRWGVGKFLKQQMLKHRIESLFRLWETAAQCLRSHTQVGLKLKARSSRQAVTGYPVCPTAVCIGIAAAAQRNPQWSHAQPSPLSTLNSWEHGNYPLPLIFRGELRLMSYSKHMWQQKTSYRNDPVQVFPWNHTHHHTITLASLLHPSAPIQHWHLSHLTLAAIVLIYMHIAFVNAPEFKHSFHSYAANAMQYTVI